MPVATGNYRTVWYGHQLAVCQSGTSQLASRILRAAHSPLLAVLPHIFSFELRHGRCRHARTEPDPFFDVVVPSAAVIAQAHELTSMSRDGETLSCNASDSLTCRRPRRRGTAEGSP